jgi:hypothetical protein
LRDHDTGRDTAARVSEIRWWERAYFGVITVAALFVSWLGFFKPARMDESFTWAVLPPLHARFVAALYLFGGVYLLGCTVARYLAQVRPAPLAVVLFTSLLLLITLLNPDAFDYDLGPVKVWTGSYVVYPLLGLVVIALMGGRPGVEPPGRVLPAWGRWVLLAQAAAFGVSGLLLLVARDTMVDAWPWPIDVGLAQFYGGPFVALAWCAVAYSRQRSLSAVLPIVAGTLAFTVATLVVSLVHLELFSGDDLSAWVWFGGFGALTVALAAMVLGARPQADFQG